ncbi:hypothetical protein MTYM_01345 [Methylococcales bacterium]|nr:hypothetical protein MTYM_01345 [Methylococcales bacterium]
MNANFQIINDRKFDFISEVSLRNEVIKAGRKKVIFVEGYDDKIIFGILFSDYLDRLYFIDVSLEEAKRIDNENLSAEGGCERVKRLLSDFVSNIPQERRFYGIIDRDLKKDYEIETEKNNRNYDKKLFIFTERYTLENYFISLDVLLEFIKGQSYLQKKLIPLSSNKSDFQSKILNPIYLCFVKIGAANLTIQYFNSLKAVGEKRISYIRKNIECESIEDEIFSVLHEFNITAVQNQFDTCKNFISESEENIQKFVSAKTYFDFNFDKKLKEYCGTPLSINRYKSELARILKEKGLPNDFKELLEFLGC